MIEIPLGTHAPFYQTYIDKVKDHPVTLLNDQLSWMNDYITTHGKRLAYAYAENKWTIRQVIMHIMDTEQVFAYRLLRIARGDQTPLPGFNQNVFIEGNDFSHLGMKELSDLFRSRRQASIHLINSLNNDQLLRVGTASEQQVSAGSLIYMMAGHAQHHWDILLERYKA